MVSTSYSLVGVVSTPEAVVCWAVVVKIGSLVVFNDDVVVVTTVVSPRGVVVRSTVVSFEVERVAVPMVSVVNGVVVKKLVVVVSSHMFSHLVLPSSQIL